MSKIRQKLLRKKLSENLRKKPKKPTGKMMREVGYSKSYSKKPKQWFNTKAGKDFLAWLDYEIEQVANRMNEERNKAKYKELADTLVNLKKLQQTLEGKPGEIVKFELTDEQFNQIIRREAKRINNNQGSKKEID